MRRFTQPSFSPRRASNADHDNRRATETTTEAAASQSAAHDPVRVVTPVTTLTRCVIDDSDPRAGPGHAHAFSRSGRIGPKATAGQRGLGVPLKGRHVRSDSGPEESGPYRDQRGDTVACCA
jgi:hypothetical protein